jgi:hypothetical protein
VPDRRRHRGPLPADEELFAPAQQAVLDRAAAWVDLVGPIIEERAPGAWLLDLGDLRRELAHETP